MSNRHILILLLWLAGIMSDHRGTRAEGTVSEGTTPALLQALLGGGLVRMTFTNTLTLETPILISADTTLEGAHPAGLQVTLSGGGQYRLFRVLPGIRFELRHCVLRDGLATNGAAILNEGVLVVSNVNFTACSAIGPDGAPGRPGENRFGIGGDGTDGQGGTQAAGGAIHNLGVATIQRCTFLGNEATGGDGGAGGGAGEGTVLNGRGGNGGHGAPGQGGAIFSEGPLTVMESVFTANVTRGGNGAAGGSAVSGTATNGMLGAGQGGAGALSAGGAIHSEGLLLVTQCSFATNLVVAGASANAGAPTVNIGHDGFGGGHALGGAIASWSEGAIINTTFYTNLIVGGQGGNGAAGTFIAGHGGNGGNALGAAVHLRGSLGLTNVTLAWNTGTNGAPGTAAPGGFARHGEPGLLAGSALAVEAGTGAALINSILLSGNVSTVFGRVTDAGHNLFSDSGTGTQAAGSRYSIDPLLDEYRVWTEGTPGLLPRIGSPAVDAADPAAAPPHDQRGLPRPTGSGPEIGALEAAFDAFFIAGSVLSGTNGLPGITLVTGEESQVSDGQGGFRFGPLPTGYYIVEPVHGGFTFTPRLVQVPLFSDVTNLVFQAAPITLGYTRDRVSGTFFFFASGRAGEEYRLEGGPNLGTWDTLVRAQADANGRIAFEHNPGSARHWFYRLATESPAE
jgi:hypothetical protein